MPGWRFVTTTVEGQPLSIGGLDPWQYQWRRVSDATARIRDPQHGQAYGFPVYEIGDPSNPVRFAAGEFSASVWGFYQPE
jgi:hypothetical protein